MTQTVPEPVAKRADQLVVGDRILHHSLPTSFFSAHGDVVFVRRYEHHGAGFVFVAYWQESGYESTTYVADGVVKVHPADPTGQLYSRADDGETTQPIAGRIPPHYGVVEVAGGLVEIDPPEGFVPASTGGLSPIHFGFLGIGTACGLPAEGSDRRSQVSVWAGVTCEECLKQSPASAARVCWHPGVGGSPCDGGGPDCGPA